MSSCLVLLTKGVMVFLLLPGFITCVITWSSNLLLLTKWFCIGPSCVINLFDVSNKGSDGFVLTLFCNIVVWCCSQSV